MFQNYKEVNIADSNHSKEQITNHALSILASLVEINQETY